MIKDVNLKSLEELEIVRRVDLGRNQILINVGKIQAVVEGSFQRISDIQLFTNRSELENMDLLRSGKAGLVDATTILYHALDDDSKRNWESHIEFASSFSNKHRMEVIALALGYLALLFYSESDNESKGGESSGKKPKQSL